MGLFNFFKRAKVAEKHAAFYPAMAMPEDILDECRYLGTDLVELKNSGPCCERCAKFRSRIYSMSGKDKRFPKFPSDYKPDGCLSAFPFVENVMEPSFSDPDIVKFSNRPFVDDRTSEEKEQYEEWQRIKATAEKPVPQNHTNNTIPVHTDKLQSPIHIPPIEVSRLIKEEVEWRRQQYTDELDYVDRMDGQQFENWCADILRKNGFNSVNVTQASRDQGVDVLAQKDGIKYAIQCKCYSSDLGNKPVQEVNTGRAIYRCHVGAVMTNRYFTIGAKEAAEATGVLLWDRNMLKSMLQTDSDVTSLPPAPVEYEETNQWDDAIFDAVDVMLETGTASVSLIQRRLKLGYARAARLVDQLERLGIIGPFAGATPRKLLITKDQWQVMKQQL